MFGSINRLKYFFLFIFFAVVFLVIFFFSALEYEERKDIVDTDKDWLFVSSGSFIKNPFCMRIPGGGFFTDYSYVLYCTGVDVRFMDKASCLDSGRVFLRDYYAQAFHCYDKYDDGGSTCTSSDDCIGDCLIPAHKHDQSIDHNGNMSGVCQNNSQPSNLYCMKRIEDKDKGGIFNCAGISF